MTEEEKKEKNRAAQRRYWARNKERIREKNKAACKKYYYEHHQEMLDKKKEYRDNNKELLKEKRDDYLATQRGRANNILSQYRNADKRRGLECTITTEFIETKIFTGRCVYCGESDWKKLGCDRINNNLPHTKDNVVCSCWDCNDDRNKKKMTVEEYKEYKKNG